MSEVEVRAALLAAVPDEPANVDTRGVLLEDSKLFGDADGCVALRADRRLLVAVREPDGGAFAAALDQAHPEAELVASGRAIAFARRHLGSDGEAAVVHRVGAAGLRRDPDWPEAVLLEAEAPLGDFTPEVLTDIELHRGSSPIGVVVENGAAVSICYPVITTERYWDVSIETAPGYRRAGRAAAAFLRVEAEMARRGLEPVWGAHESNAASLALAAKLGFERVGRIVVFEAGVGG